MTKSISLKSLIATVFVIFAMTLAPLQSADENPFAMPELSSGTSVADRHGGHGKHRKMKMMDADGDGSISKDEFMAHAEKKFEKKDKNGDGVLSGDEMKKGCKCCKKKKGCKKCKSAYEDKNDKEA